MTSAFPPQLAPHARQVAEALPPSRFGPVGQWSATLDGGPVTIPRRIYADPIGSVARTWDPTARLLASCLYTRHHDGYVRQQNLRRITGSLEPWVLPFVVHLVGEYVVEIVQDIADALCGLETEGSAQRRAYAAFVAANPELLRLIDARAASYWDCYYRRPFRRVDDYPGRQVARALARSTD